MTLKVGDIIKMEVRDAATTNSIQYEVVSITTQKDPNTGKEITVTNLMPVTK